MEPEEILAIISRNEDTKHQFKADAHNADQLAAEMVAFSNVDGGQILIGVGNEGQISGLTREDMGRINQLVANAAAPHVKRCRALKAYPDIAFADDTEGNLFTVTIARGAA